MRGSVAVDLRNVYDPAAMREAGRTTASAGRLEWRITGMDDHPQEPEQPPPAWRSGL